MTNISGLLGSTGVALEAEAYKQFGSAVENQVGAKLSGIFGLGGSSSIRSDADIAAGTSETRVWDPTPYASAFTNLQGAGFDPKNKFLFKVKFKFHPVAIEMATNLGVDLGAISSNITFTVKQIDLPKVDFDYEEVNMYNFRTKVLKSIKFRELSFIIYDDVANHAIRLIKAYLELMSPITRARRDGGTKLEDHGFSFAQNMQHGVDTALRGSLGSIDVGGNKKEIISEIIVEQFYVKMSAKPAAIARDLVFLNRYAFANPRISQFDISDQDHDQGDSFNTISMTFEYDSLHIEVEKPGSSTEITPFDGGDMMGGMNNTGPYGAPIRSVSDQAGNTQNPLVNILANQAKRAASSYVSGALNNALGGLGGGMLGGAIGKISGTLGNQVGKTMMNAGQRVSQGMAAPSVSLVKDNAGGPPASETASIYTDP